MKLDVLAIGAHPDDVELSCGGTIIKLVKQGYHVGIVDLSEGELGTRGSGEIRKKEAEAAARIMRVDTRLSLGIADGNIEVNSENRNRVISVIREHCPEILMIPYSIDRHPDHERAHTLCREAWYYAGLTKLETKIQGKAQAAFRPKAYYEFMQWYEFVPSFLVDISGEFEQRMEAVRAFRSQFHDPASKEPQTMLSQPGFLEMIETRLRYYGSRIGRKYAEPFFSVNPITINDLKSLAG